MAEEKVFHSDENGVKVTNARFVVGSTVYPISGITSVKVHKIPSGDREEFKYVVGFIVIGLITIIVGFSSPINFTTILIGFGILGLGVFGASRMKDIYILKISTAGGEIEALKNEGDPDYVNNIVKALNESIVQNASQ